MESLSATLSVSGTVLPTMGGGPPVLAWAAMRDGRVMQARLIDLDAATLTKADLLNLASDEGRRY